MTTFSKINQSKTTTLGAVLAAMTIAALLVQNGSAQQTPNKDTRWIKPAQSSRALIETDIYDSLNATMDHSTALVLEKVGQPHLIYLSGATEKWIYFVSPNQDQPYVVELLIKNGKVQTVGREMVGQTVN